MKLKARARLGEDSRAAEAGAAAAQRRTSRPRYEQLRTLPFGTWFEFVTNQQGDVVRRRLSWFSPVTDNALFVNQRGQRVGEQSLDSLARMIAPARPASSPPSKGRLVDRAWHAALNALRSFAGSGEARTRRRTRMIDEFRRARRRKVADTIHGRRHDDRHASSATSATSPRPACC